MRLLISDANILIDMEAGALLETLFRLPVQIGIPDILYYEEIEPGTPGLERMGLQVMEVAGDFVEYAQRLPAKHGSKPSHNDYLALALAKQEACTLLTGDASLRAIADQEGVAVMGTIGLLRAMVENQLLSVDAAIHALDTMRHHGRRLPWQEAEARLNALRQSTPV
jgi:predicted nucleic acid-binding protein